MTRDGVATPEIHLGTLAERDRMRSDRTFQSSFSVDVENLEALKRSFPITSRYWGETDAVPAIFNNAPRMGMMSLGQYYLVGKTGVASSYAQVILPLLAAGASPAARDTPY